MGSHYRNSSHYRNQHRASATLRWGMAIAFCSTFALFALFVTSQPSKHRSYDAPPADVPYLRYQPEDAEKQAPKDAYQLPDPVVRTPNQTNFHAFGVKGKPAPAAVEQTSTDSYRRDDAEDSVVTGVPDKTDTNDACSDYPQGSIRYRDCKREMQLSTRNR